MILVDVYVPSVDATYDLELDENVEISDVIDKISDMLCAYLNMERKDEKKFMLCSLSKKKILNGHSTLSANDIRNGDKFLLV